MTENQISVNSENLSETVKALLRERPDTANKGTFGTLSVIAGSVSYRGCAALACRAALRAGAGIVRLVSIEEVCSAAVARCPEITLRIAEKTPSGSIGPSGVRDAVRGSDAILAGCGMTVSADTARSVAEVLYSGIPAVLDADALNSLAAAGGTDMLDGRGAVITPHVGEAARITGLSVGMIKQNLAGTCGKFASKHRCVAVFKDFVTAVSDGERLALVQIPNSGLARGGSGDVLAGVISSLRAQGYGGFEAALLGVCLHSAAGLAAREIYGDSMLPSDTADLILSERSIGKGDTDGRKQ